MAQLPDTKKKSTRITPGLLTLLLLLAILIPLAGCAHRVDKLEKLKEKSNVHYRLGNEYYNSGNISDAMKAYLKAISIYPEEPSYHLMLGFAYSARALDARAEVEMKKAIELNPMFSEAHVGLAYIYKKAGNWDGVIDESKLALKNIFYKTPEAAYLNMGIAYYEKADYKAAIDSLEKAVALKPELALAYYNMGLAFEGLKKRHEAISSYRKAVELKAEYMEPYYRLGLLFVKSRENGKARTAFEKVVKLAPGSASAVSARDYLDLLK